MKRVTSALLVLASVGALFAGGIVYEADFTQGSSGIASPGEVTGGTFVDGGWKQTTGGDRIMYVSPTPIKSGWAEMRFIPDKQISTSDFTNDKCIYWSIFDCEALNQGTCPMKAYVRIRKESSRDYYIEFKARDIAQLHGEGETRIYSRDDWNNYVGQEVALRYTWSDNSDVKLTYPKQDGSGDTGDLTRPYKITDIKYVVVGSENSYNCACKTWKYTGLTVYDDAATGDVTSARADTRAASPRTARYHQHGDKISFKLTKHETADIYTLGGSKVCSVNATSPRLDGSVLSPGAYVLSVGHGAVRTSGSLVVR